MVVLRFLQNSPSEYHVFFYKIRHVYSTVHQLWSNSHQLIQIFIIINRFFFILHSLYIQSSNRLGKFCPRIFLSRINTFAAVDIQPSKKTLFFKLIFSTSFIDFEKVFKKSDILWKEVRSSSFGMSSIKVLRLSLCGKY